jgi:Arc/MetJ-type ribon-helix-helix transcriptional regulator
MEYVKETLMNLNVPPEFQSFVSSLVARRRFLSENEVLVESLRLLQARESLVEEVQKGFEQIDQGQSVDGPTAFANLRQGLEGRKN